MKILRNFFFVIIAIGFLNKTYSQEVDIWSGNYVVRSSESVPMDTMRIQKTSDINKEDVASRYESDLSRWEISSKSDSYEDKVLVRRFLFDLEDDENEYEEFGWTELHLNKEMNCLDAGHFFICRTKPNSEIAIGDEFFFTETGLFGIRLHYGLFELEKLD